MENPSDMEIPSGNDRLTIPSWMMSAEPYVPETDHDGFITKSVLRVLGLLAEIRDNALPGRGRMSAAMKMIATLFLIVLTAVSKNMFFTYVMTAYLLVRIALLPERPMRRVARSAFSIAALTALLMLPAAFLGSPKTMLTVSLKVFFSVGMICVMSVTTPWNQLTGALKVFHVPDLFIFVFDMTIKYIAILGGLCLQILDAVRLRSVGRNHHKGDALSGILGVTFLKAQEMSSEMYGAMVCRGFEGEYHRRKRNPFRRLDILPAAACAAAAFLFAYLESAM